jgi:hypothetical protein
MEILKPDFFLKRQNPGHYGGNFSKMIYNLSFFMLLSHEACGETPPCAAREAHLPNKRGKINEK